MKKIFFLTTALVVGLFLAQASYADNFIKFFNYAAAHSVQQTADGGYILGGWTGASSIRESKALLLKLAPSGNILWQKAIGANITDVLYSVQQTSDGGYIAAGRTSWGGTGMDILLIKLDGSGNILWLKTIGDSSLDIAYSIQQTSDGGYILAGLTHSSNGYGGLLLKLDPSGNILWQKKVIGWTVFESVQETSDGGYIALGGTLLIKTDSSGNIVWQKIYSVYSDGKSHFKSVQQTSDGGYIMAGYRAVNYIYNNSNTDVLILKLDQSGNIIWQKTYGGIKTTGLGNQADGASSVEETSDGGYIIGGTTQAANDNDALLLKIDHSGGIVWKEAIRVSVFGGYFSFNRSGYVQQTSDGGYVLAGFTGHGLSNVVAIKVDSSGGGVEACDLIKDINLSVTDSSLTAQDSSFAASDASLSVASPAIKTGTLNLVEETLCYGTSNHPPLANAGTDQTIQLQSCSGSTVTLDGSASQDPDGDSLTYTWTWDGGSADGVNPAITLPYEHTTVTLSVDDGKGGTASDTVDINIVDTIAPSLNVSVNPSVIWPPNHKYVKIAPSVNVNDACAAAVNVELVSAMSSEPDNGLGDGDTANDIAVNADGTISLRAERSGTGNGRVYTITYKATDLAGNATVASSTVAVPHDMGKK